MLTGQGPKKAGGLSFLRSTILLYSAAVVSVLGSQWLLTLNRKSGSVVQLSEIADSIRMLERTLEDTQGCRENLGHLLYPRELEGELELRSLFATPQPMVKQVRFDVGKSIGVFRVSGLTLRLLKTRVTGPGTVRAVLALELDRDKQGEQEALYLSREIPIELSFAPPKSGVDHPILISCQRQDVSNRDGEPPVSETELLSYLTEQEMSESQAKGNRIISKVIARYYPRIGDRLLLAARAGLSGKPVSPVLPPKEDAPEPQREPMNIKAPLTLDDLVSQGSSEPPTDWSTVETRIINSSDSRSDDGLAARAGVVKNLGSYISGASLFVRPDDRISALSGRFSGQITLGDAALPAPDDEQFAMSMETTATVTDGKLTGSQSISIKAHNRPALQFSKQGPLSHIRMAPGDSQAFLIEVPGDNDPKLSYVFQLFVRRDRSIVGNIYFVYGDASFVSKFGQIATAYGGWVSLNRE